MENQNLLYHGDNLDILRRYVKDETIDLVYLDPPFKSNQDYNVLFAEQNGSRAAAQIKAFEDTWIIGTNIYQYVHLLASRCHKFGWEIIKGTETTLTISPFRFVKPRFT